MEQLKTNYKNDIFTGPRKYEKTDNPDGSISLNDVTVYDVTGDIYAAADINNTNQAVNEFYGEFNTTVAKLTDVLSLTLPVANWNSTAPFIQTIVVPTMKNTYVPVPGVIYPDGITESQKSQILKSLPMIDHITTNNGSVTFKCDFKKPTIDLTITLKGV
jgi:hypothetical protein